MENFAFKAGNFTSETKRRLKECILQGITEVSDEVEDSVLLLEYVEVMIENGKTMGQVQHDISSFLDEHQAASFVKRLYEFLYNLTLENESAEKSDKAHTEPQHTPLTQLERRQAAGSTAAPIKSSESSRKIMERPLQAARESKRILQEESRHERSSDVADKPTKVARLSSMVQPQGGKTPVKQAKGERAGRRMVTLAAEASAHSVQRPKSIERKLNTPLNHKRTHSDKSITSNSIKTGSENDSTPGSKKRTKNINGAKQAVKAQDVEEQHEEYYERPAHESEEPYDDEERTFQQRTTAPKSNVGPGAAFLPDMHAMSEQYMQMMGFDNMQNMMQAYQAQMLAFANPHAYAQMGVPIGGRGRSPRRGRGNPRGRGGRAAFSRPPGRGNMTWVRTTDMSTPLVSKR